MISACFANGRSFLLNDNKCEPISNDDFVGRAIPVAFQEVDVATLV